MKAKVHIEITEGQTFVEGGSYTSVGFEARRYGSGSPCTSSEEIKQAIERCKEWILEEGDIPLIKDNREKAKLTNWF